MASRAVGFTYVLSNPAMPGMVKVGYTTALAEDHVKELYSTAVPLPYVVEFDALTSYPDEVKARAHKMLDWHRVAKDRDFFRVAPNLAIEAVRDALLDEAGLAAWNSGKVHQVRDGDRVALTAARGDKFVVLAYPSREAERAEPVDLWEACADGDLLELMAGDAGYVSGLGDYDARAELDPVPYADHGAARPNGEVTGRERLVPGDRLLWLRHLTEGSVCMRAAFEFGAFCQVVRRTWEPGAAADGSPPRLDYLAGDEQPECVVQATKDALALPRPKAWAPRDPDPEDDWIAAVVGPPRSESRLAQLGKRRRSREKNAAANHAPPGQLPLF